MKRVVTLLSGIVLLATIGVGTASADPINKNSRYLTVNCNGEILDIVTESGTAAQVLGDTRVAVLHGLRDGDVWLSPISNGQSKADLLEAVVERMADGVETAWADVMADPDLTGAQWLDAVEDSPERLVVDPRLRHHPERVRAETAVL